jgi:hypothetical protein
MPLRESPKRVEMLNIRASITIDLSFTTKAFDAVAVADARFPNLESEFQKVLSVVNHNFESERDARDLDNCDVAVTDLRQH